MVEPVTTALATKAAARAVDGLSETATNFASGITGATGQATGLLITDRIGLRRWKSAIKMLEEAAAYAKERGINPNSVPLKNFVPILEGCSLEEEEDDDMISRWASLLTNSADDDGAEVPPSFADLLRQLSSLEAQILDYAYAVIATNLPRDQWWARGLKYENLVERAAPTPEPSIRLACNNLLRLGLCQPQHSPLGEANRIPISSDEPAVGLSEYGYAFVNACRKPEDWITPPLVSLIPDKADEPTPEPSPDSDDATPTP